MMPLGGHRRGGSIARQLKETGQPLPGDRTRRCYSVRTVNGQPGRARALANRTSNCKVKLDPTMLCKDTRQHVEDNQ
eukprot:155811-Hanusia_phi.AAC.1